MKPEDEIKLLKQTVKALAKINRFYTIETGEPPGYVFTAIARARKVYGWDLTKIKG